MYLKIKNIKNYQTKQISIGIQLCENYIIFKPIKK